MYHHKDYGNTTATGEKHFTRSHPTTISSCVNSLSYAHKLYTRACTFRTEAKTAFWY